MSVLLLQAEYCYHIAYYDESADTLLIVRFLFKEVLKNDR